MVLTDRFVIVPRLLLERRHDPVETVSILLPNVFFHDSRALLTRYTDLQPAVSVAMGAGSATASAYNHRSVPSVAVSPCTPAGENGIKSLAVDKIYGGEWRSLAGPVGHTYL